jgi:aldose 1-epimerase
MNPREIPDELESADGLHAVRITSAGGETEAEFVPNANMLCCSLRHRATELLDVGDGVGAYAHRGKTMGIPLLYPWANRLGRPGYRAAGKVVELPSAEGRFALDPNGLPIHGALPGLLRWHVAPESPGDRISARLDWRAEPLLELFPFVHEVELEARVGDGELELTTTVRATGEDSVPVAFGYHPYLTVPGVDRQSWQVTLGASRRLLLDERMIPTGERQPLGRLSFALQDESWDDGLDGLSEPPRFQVAAGALALTMTFDCGFSFAQVYAPAGRDFICFEPMTAPTDALNSGDGLTLVAPGEEYRACFSIKVAGAV